MDEVKRIDIKEFRALGFLQEINRQFLHPLGLALEVIVDDEGNETLGGVWDYREDPEGMFFSPKSLSSEKAHHVENLRESKVKTRLQYEEGGVETDMYGIQVVPEADIVDN